MIQFDSKESCSILDNVAVIIDFSFDVGVENVTHSVVHETRLNLNNSLGIEAETDIAINLYESNSDTFIRLVANIFSNVNREEKVIINYSEDFSIEGTEGNQRLIDEIVSRVQDTLFGEIKFVKA